MKHRRNSQSDDNVKDANEKLRAENRRLRKQLNQLQKQLNKSTILQKDEWDMLEEELYPEKQQVLSKQEDKCVKCKHPLVLVQAGIFEIRLCENCGWKKRKALTAG